MGDILDMDKAMSEDPKFVDFVAGNHVLEGSIPISHRYGGHQFGSWVSFQANIAYENYFKLHLILNPGRTIGRWTRDFVGRIREQ